MLSSEREPTISVYTQAEPNEPIDLGTETVRFCCQGTTFEREAHVQQRFLPDPRLCLTIPGKGEDPMLGLRFYKAHGFDGNLNLVRRNLDIKVLPPSIGGEDGAATFRPMWEPISIYEPSDNLVSAVAHVFNFPEFYGESDTVVTSTDGRSATRCGRIMLTADPWNMVLTATQTISSQSQALRARGGFCITHTALMGRLDQAQFTSEQLGDFVDTARLYLSFAAGRWVALALPVGYNAARQVVFEQWGMPTAATGAWNGACSCFDPMHSGFLSRVFPGFYSLCQNERWKRPTREALYWYLAANERGTGIGLDTGVVLAQTALELLAWTHCVQDRKMVSAEAFQPRGLSAADKLRLLLASLDIPRHLPDQLAPLRHRRGRSWEDGPDAITDIRNSIVHPHAKRKLPDGAYLAAWQLCLWYVDMVLLRLCGYAGTYSNRLNIPKGPGAVEVVPWALGNVAEKKVGLRTAPEDERPED